MWNLSRSLSIVLVEFIILISSFFILVQHHHLTSPHHSGGSGSVASNGTSNTASWPRTPTAWYPSAGTTTPMSFGLQPLSPSDANTGISVSWTIIFCPNFSLSISFFSVFLSFLSLETAPSWAMIYQQKKVSPNTFFVSSSGWFILDLSLAQDIEHVMLLITSICVSNNKLIANMRFSLYYCNTNGWSWIYFHIHKTITVKSNWK